MIPVFALMLLAQTHLTVYEAGFAVVEEPRSFSLRKGVQRIPTAQLPLALEPTSASLLLKGAEVLEKRFSFPLTGTEPPLEDALGRVLEAVLEEGEAVAGTLALVAPGHLLLRTRRGVVAVARNRILRWALKEPPWTLPATPVIHWTVKADRAGQTRGTLTYLTQGFRWNAHYVADLEDQQRLRLTGWIHLQNESGKTYADASVVLVSGQVHRVTQPLRGTKTLAMESRAPSQALYPVESPVGEYHRYTLPGRYTLPSREALEVKLLDRSSVPARFRYVYRQGETVDWQLRFVNPAEPMPAGRIQVYTRDQGQRVLLGEDWIPHTPRGDTVTVSLGVAYDLRARESLEREERVAPQVWERTWKITLQNFKDQPVDIEVERSVPPGSELVDSSVPPVRSTARTLVFRLRVPARARTVLEYTLRSR